MVLLVSSISIRTAGLYFGEDLTVMTELTVFFKNKRTAVKPVVRFSINAIKSYEVYS